MLFICLFGLRVKVPVNIFSVMSGRSYHFLGITSTFRGVNVSCSMIQHGDLSEDRTLAAESDALPLGPRASLYAILPGNDRQSIGHLTDCVWFVCLYKNRLLRDTVDMIKIRWL